MTMTNCVPEFFDGGGDEGSLCEVGPAVSWMSELAAVVTDRSILRYCCPNFLMFVVR